MFDTENKSVSGQLSTTSDTRRQHLDVIVVVEGASGAGKTTWTAKHGARYALLEALPDHAVVPGGEEAAARFWVERNVARWHEVVERERRDGLVVVDTDPLKLHFTWSLYEVGYASRREWELARDVAREAVASSRYGLADLVFVSDVDETTLRVRRDGDATRTRRNFERHVRLRETTLRWYRAVAEIDARRVVFGLPDDGIRPEHLALGPRPDRYDLTLFDELVARLEREGA